MPAHEDAATALPDGSLVIPLDKVSSQDHALLGSKAFNLGLMWQAGLPVPSGFCVTTMAFREWIARNQASRAALERFTATAVGDQNAVSALAAALREELSRAPVPRDVCEAIRQGCAQFGAATSWAVRSSATMEDRAGGSCAGQHDSFLWVEGTEAVIESVRRCWVSLFTDRAVRYRARRQLSSESAAMAVVVQEMVSAELAGVLFSGDPVRRDANRIVIEAAPGCGDRVVAGRVTPERLVLDRTSLEVLERNDPEGLEPTSHAPILTPTLSHPRGEGARRAGEGKSAPRGPVLDDNLARRLAGLAFEVERLLGGPLDLEWAACNGTVHLLQARPITTPLGPTSRPSEVWCIANACENLPGVLTPMSWSLVKLLLAGSFRPILQLIGIDTNVRPWFGRIAGRVYLNAGLSEELLKRLHLAKHVSVWDLLGGRPSHAEAMALEAVRRRSGRLSWPKTLGLLWLALCSIPATRQQCGDAFLRTMRQRLDALAETPFAFLPDTELTGFITGIVPRVFPEIGAKVALVRVLACLGPGLVCAHALQSVTRCWLEEAEGRLAQRLLRGAGDMASANSALDLWRLAEWARGRDTVMQALETAGPFVEVRGRLRASPEGAAFLDRWEEFMRRHGHHAHGEADAFNPRWSETPDELLDMVRHYLRLVDCFNPVEAQSARKREGEALLQDCRRRLRNPAKRWLLGYLVRRAQRGLAFRENVKSEAVRSVALIRAALLEAGRRLKARRLVAEGEDVFFLEIDELQRTLGSSPVTGMTDLVKGRKAERTRLQAIEAPSIVVGDFAPHGSGAHAFPEAEGELKGLGVSPGLVVGRARVFPQDAKGARLLPGEILVAPSTDPGWTLLFVTAAGIVADMGGQLSHGSIIAREYGIPAVVNVGHATRIIRTGQMIEVDGDRGVVRVVAA